MLFFYAVVVPGFEAGLAADDGGGGLAGPAGAGDLGGAGLGASAGFGGAGFGASAGLVATAASAKANLGEPSISPSPKAPTIVY